MIEKDDSISIFRGIEHISTNRAQLKLRNYFIILTISGIKACVARIYMMRRMDMPINQYDVDKKKNRNCDNKSTLSHDLIYPPNNLHTR